MRIWFVTGASRGFGALIVKEALAKGDAVVATARNPKTVTDRFGDHPNLLAVELDVNDESQAQAAAKAAVERRSEEHTSELQSLMRISYDVFCLKKTNQN